MANPLIPLTKPPVPFDLLREQFIAWFQAYIWTYGTLTQGIMIAVALTVAAIIHKFSTSRVIHAINSRKAPARVKQILHTLRRLLYPFTALVVLYFVYLLNALGLGSARYELVGAAMHLLVAWIFIRLAVQVIDNSFIRNIFAIAIWGIAALSILGVLDETLAALNAFGTDIGGFRLSALTLIKAVLALSFLLYGALFVSSLLERRIRRVSGLTMSSRVLLSKTIRIVLVTFALLIAVTSAGIDLSLLAVFSGAVGLGVGFGLQKVISNLFSGMLLLMDKSIKPGDIIELQNGVYGWVQHMGARYTEIVTRDNKSYLVPNEDFITHPVVNWSHGDTLVRLETKFIVHYDSDPHLVKKIAEEAAVRPDRVVHDPKPQCHLVEFGESSLNFVLRYWIRDAEKGVVNMRGAVMLALWDAFKEHGIKIPYPHREVFLHDKRA